LAVLSVTVAWYAVRQIRKDFEKTSSHA
jgi:hypothetical protein